MKKFRMRKYPVLLMLVGLGFILFACQQAENVGETEVPVVEPVETATEVAVVEPTVEMPTEVPETDKCVECHTDKDQLIDTADPVVEVESENEGAG